MFGQLCKDDVPLVRKGACGAIGSFAKVLGASLPCAAPACVCLCVCVRARVLACVLE